MTLCHCNTHYTSLYINIVDMTLFIHPAIAEIIHSLHFHVFSLHFRKRKAKFVTSCLMCFAVTLFVDYMYLLWVTSRDA